MKVTCLKNASLGEPDFRGWRKLGTGVALSVFIKSNPAVGIKLTNLGEGVSLGRPGCFFSSIAAIGASVRAQQKPSRHASEELEQCGVDTLGEENSCYGEGGNAGDGVEVRAVVRIDAGRFSDCVDACEH